MKKTHELKILSLYYDAVQEGRKTFEVRKNDRNFKNADTVILKEWSQENGYSGREMQYEVGWVLDLGAFLNHPTDYVVFSLIEIYK